MLSGIQFIFQRAVTLFDEFFDRTTSRRAHGLPFMRTVHHRRFLILGLFEYFDHSR